MTMMKDGMATTDPRLGRLPRFDDRSRNYPIRQLVKATKLRSYTWQCGEVLDQGQEGACVGFGFAHELIAKPRVVKGVTDQYAEQSLYWNIQRMDQWPGGSYPGAQPKYDGTSVLDGAKYMKAQGWYDEYRWAFGEEDLAMAVAYHGPAVIGVNWYEGMFDVNPALYVGTDMPVIQISGELAGGHCILVNGIYLTNTPIGSAMTSDEHGGGYYRLHNSWGPTWGTGGEAFISRLDMARLLAEDGEACVPVVRMPKTSV